MVASMGFERPLHPIRTAGVNVSFRDIYGWTVLHWAARFGRKMLRFSSLLSKRIPKQLQRTSLDHLSRGRRFTGKKNPDEAVQATISPQDEVVDTQPKKNGETRKQQPENQPNTNNSTKQASSGEHSGEHSNTLPEQNGDKASSREHPNMLQNGDKTSGEHSNNDSNPRQPKQVEVEAFTDLFFQLAEKNIDTKVLTYKALSGKITVERDEPYDLLFDRFKHAFGDTFRTLVGWFFALGLIRVPRQVVLRLASSSGIRLYKCKLPDWISKNCWKRLIRFYGRSFIRLVDLILGSVGLGGTWTLLVILQKKVGALTDPAGHRINKVDANSAPPKGKLDVPSKEDDNDVPAMQKKLEKEDLESKLKDEKEDMDAESNISKDFLLGFGLGGAAFTVLAGIVYYCFAR